MYVGMCVPHNVWKSEDKSLAPVLTLHHVCFRNGTQATRVGSEPLHSPSHLTSPESSVSQVLTGCFCDSGSCMLLSIEVLNTAINVLSVTALHASPSETARNGYYCS